MRRDTSSPTISCFFWLSVCIFTINCAGCLCFFVPQHTCRVFPPVDSGSGVDVDAAEERAAEEGDKGAIDALHANNIALLALRTPGRVR